MLVSANTLSPKPPLVSTETLTPIPIQTQSIIFTPTSNFINLKPQVVTPSLPETCPEIRNNSVSFPDDPQEYFLTMNRSDGIKEFGRFVDEVLNQGGLNDLLSYLKTHGIEYYVVDLTNDGVNELVIDFIAIDVFGCKNEKFENLITLTPDMELGKVLSLEDINANGVNDLVLAMQFNGFHYYGIYVLEWNNDRFESLISNWRFDSYENRLISFGGAYLLGESELFVQDINDDGFQELIIDGGIPTYLGGSSGGDGPWRPQKVIYMWNGEYFAWYSQEYSPPNFRFEAIQDGDIQTFRGDYVKALQSYEAAIFKKDLISWDQDRWLKVINERTDLHYPDIEEFPFNQVEYEKLSAYARYRIIILHLLNERYEDAKRTYEILLEKHPVNDNGYPYVMLATEFWNEYQVSKSIVSACQKSVQYARSHLEILEPLYTYGSFDQYYTPETICPFL